MPKPTLKDAQTALKTVRATLTNSRYQGFRSLVTLTDTGPKVEVYTHKGLYSTFIGLLPFNINGIPVIVKKEAQ
jgi:hypothetical protein